MSIVINQVSKNFGPVQALQNVSLTLEEGKIYGLLGRNGAGKSTLLNILTDRIFPNGGSVTLDGEPVHNNDRPFPNVPDERTQLLSRFYEGKGRFPVDQAVLPRL